MTLPRLSGRAGALVLCFAIGCGATADEVKSKPGPEPVPPLLGASGVQIVDVALYQGVKRPLVEAGQPSASTLPIVAKRDALVRVFVASDGSFTGALTGRLHVGSGEPIEVTQTLSGASTDADLGTTLNFQVPGSRLASNTDYKIEIGQRGEIGDKGDAPAAYPSGDPAPLFVESIGEVLKITIVPVRYNADGSGRVPDFSEPQLDLYRQAFGAMYPAPEMEFTVREPMDWGGNVSAFGNGWDNLLGQIADLRQSDGAPSDVYYFGSFVPANSVGAYCNQGCVAGLAMAGGPNDSYARAAIGLGFSDQLSIETALHEVGHNHGRLHAPCQVSGDDQQFPYAGGKIGVWGFDRQNTKLFPPTAPDIMGYCSPAWLSDYTWVALKDRIAHVNQAASMRVVGKAEPRSYDRVRVDASGELSWLAPVDLVDAPEAEPTAVTVESADGPEQLTGQFYAYDHLPGGVLLYSKPRRLDYSAVTVELAGRVMRLSR